MSAAALPSARRVTWLRRRRALAGIWRDFRQHKPGMIGLVFLGLVVLMALSAPLLADDAGLRAINSTDNPAFASPSEFGPLGTDGLGRDVLSRVILGARVTIPLAVLLVALALTIGAFFGAVAAT